MVRLINKEAMPSVEELLAPIKVLTEQQLKKANLNKDEGLINCLYQDSWVFLKTVKGKDYPVLTDLSFSELDGITEEEKVYLRSLLLELCGGYQDQSNRLKRPGSNVIPALKSIYCFSKSQSQPLNLGLWFQETLEAWIKWIVNDKFDKVEGIAFRTLSYGYLGVVKVLHKRKILSFKPFGETKLKKITSPIIKSYASDFGYESKAEFLADWVKGKSLTTVPLEVAIVLLGYSLEVLQCDEIKILESYFLVSRNFSKKLGSSKPVNEFFESFIETLAKEGIEKYEYRLSPKSNLFNKRRAWIKAFFEDIEERFNCDDKGYSHERFDVAFDSLIERGKKHQNGSNKTVLNALHKYAGHVYDSMYVLMLCLTGFRYHEIKNINALDCINKDSTNHFRLQTTIDKTDAGFIERTVHPVIHEVVVLLNNLSYLQKDLEYQLHEYAYKDKEGNTLRYTFEGIPPLFSRSLFVTPYFSGVGPALFGTKESFVNFCNESANRMIQRVWGHASGRIEPKLKLRLEEKLGGKLLSSHGFRHTWVEFALLNFTDSTEGGVLSGIARNFGYSSKDMTNFLENYLTGKFSQAHVRRVETEVTKTLVTRLFGEVVQKAIANPKDQSVWLPEHFRGDMATKLALFVREQVEEVTMATEYELYTLAEELVEGNLVRIEPNPWGYCILFEDGKKAAACVDSKHDIQKEDAGAFDLCINCPNHLIYLPVNEEYLKQTMVTHNQIISFYQNQEEVIVDFSSSDQRALIIKASQNAIADIERQIGAI